MYSTTVTQKGVVIGESCAQVRNVYSRDAASRQELLEQHPWLKVSLLLMQVWIDSFSEAPLSPTLTLFGGGGVPGPFSFL